MKQNEAGPQANAAHTPEIRLVPNLINRELQRIEDELSCVGDEVTRSGLTRRKMLIEGERDFLAAAPETAAELARVKASCAELLAVATETLRAEEGKAHFNYDDYLQRLRRAILNAEKLT